MNNGSAEPFVEPGSNRAIAAPELFRMRWNANFSRDPNGAPLIPPRFVAEQGASVLIADIRPPEKAIGVLGYIPGSVFPGVERLEQLARDSAITAPLIIVSATGNDAQDVARRLEDMGIQNVAAMAGGLAAWRFIGFSTSRDSTGVKAEFPPVAVAKSDLGPLTLERVQKHVGDPRSVRWIKLSSMVDHGRFSCIDGRDERGVIGAPGGDSGEFLLSLAAIEKATDRKLDEKMIAQGLLARLDTFGHFCMHSDVHAFESLKRALVADERLQPVVSDLTRTEDWAEFLRSPAPDLREALLEHLVEPSHIGCGHIRLMLLNSEQYGTRRELVIYFLRAFFHLLWEGAPEVELTVLPDDHGEAAVVNIRLAEEIWGLSRIPLISPSCGERQMFINHPDVSSFLRQTTVRFFARTAGPLRVKMPLEDKLQKAVEELAARQMAATIGYLAKDLPVFDVVFAEDGSFEVRRIDA